MPNHFRKFQEQIYAGGQPSGKDLKYLKEILGVTTIVSLDQAVAQQLAPIISQLKIKHIIIPIDPGTSQITDAVRYLQRNIVNILSNNQPVYLHCKRGSDRTGLALALYRVLRNRWTCQQALTEAKRFGYGQGISPQVQKSWETLLCALSVDQSAVEDDAVTQMRQEFNGGNLPPAYNPQQSWAPFSDLDGISYNPQEQRRQERQQYFQDILDNQVPMVGQFNNLGPARGFGPVENSGMLQLL